MKTIWGKYIGDLYLSSRLYTGLAACSVLFLLRFFVGWMGVVPFIITGILLFLLIVDYIMLFSLKGRLSATRIHAERFSNGDENKVSIEINSSYHFPLKLAVIDEIPHQFQRRDVLFHAGIATHGSATIEYFLRPVKRGEYEFGHTNIYASAALALVKRRFVLSVPVTVPVYPSYIQMRKYQLMAIHNRLHEIGVRKMRQIGHTMEFEQIKEYVSGDDYRTVNWKATARRGQLMVNHYSDEKSQQVYCIIDKGRTMKMPFEGLSLLDYAINASLVLTNIALMKEDKAGLITFSERLGAMLMADRRPSQMQSVLEVLYNQKTRYLESDYERLYAHIRNRISQRSLLVLFTNFESLPGLNRQLPYLRKIAQHHLLLVVFFENTELKELTEERVNDIESIYIKTVAEKFAFEKKLIVKELHQYGILTILTPPQLLTINTVNKYLEIKARQSI